MVSSKWRRQPKKREAGKTDRNLARPGRNVDHRKGWVQDRLRDLASVFAIDLTGFAVMSNHFPGAIRLETFLKPLDWTGRALRIGIRGASPSDLAPIRVPPIYFRF